jgi:hypothetical protein
MKNALIFLAVAVPGLLFADFPDSTAGASYESER